VSPALTSRPCRGPARLLSEPPETAARLEQHAIASPPAICRHGARKCRLVSGGMETSAKQHVAVRPSLQQHSDRSTPVPFPQASHVMHGGAAAVLKNSSRQKPEVRAISRFQPLFFISVTHPGGGPITGNLVPLQSQAKTVCTQSLGACLLGRPVVARREYSTRSSELCMSFGVYSLGVWLRICPEAAPSPLDDVVATRHCRGASRDATRWNHSGARDQRCLQYFGHILLWNRSSDQMLGHLDAIGMLQYHTLLTFWLESTRG